MTFLPCDVTMLLSVNGRPFAQAEGLLVNVREGDEDVRGMAVVKFPVVAAFRDVFPSFQAAPGP